MANNQQQKKAYLKKRKASLKATKASLRKAQRKIYPWVSVKPPEFDDFRKFKKENPVLPDKRPSIPDDYVRTPLVNWEYAFGDKNQIFQNTGLKMTNLKFLSRISIRNTITVSTFMI